LVEKRNRSREERKKQRRVGKGGERFGGSLRRESCFLSGGEKLQKERGKKISEKGMGKKAKEDSNEGS